MKRGQHILMVLLALVAGLIGGFVSSHLIQPVLAEKQAKPHEVVVAEEFRLVDKDGKVIGTLSKTEYTDGPVLRLFQAKMVTMFSPHGLHLHTRTEDGKLNLDGFYTATDFRVKSGGDAISYFDGALRIDGEKGNIDLLVGENGPAIDLTEEGRVRATLGGKRLKTKKSGTLITRSPASLVLFDKKGNVIWSTPQ
jgi:hypothetical protein